MSIQFLWRNRQKAAVLSKHWWKLWAKRILNLPSLIATELRVFRLTACGCRIGELTTISASSISGRKQLLSIGSGTAIGRIQIELHAEVTIGDRAVINDGVTILTASHLTNDASWRRITAAVVIEDYAWVAVGATILPGVRIGRGAVIGAHTVVSRDVAPYSIAVGNPARITSKRRPEELCYLPTASIAAYEAWLGGGSNNNIAQAVNRKPYT